MNTPVNLLTAKLLAEKGLILGSMRSYFEPTEDYFYDGDEFHRESYKKGDVIEYEDFYYENGKRDDIFEAPTIAEALMWLYEKHGIWISVKTIKWNYEHNTIRFNYNIVKFNDKNPSDIIDVTYDYNSPTEAYEAAIPRALKFYING